MRGTIYCESLCSISSTRFLRLLRSRLVRYFYPTIAEKVESDKWTAIDRKAASDITFEFKTTSSNAIVKLQSLSEYANILLVKILESRWFFNN